MERTFKFTINDNGTITVTENGEVFKRYTSWGQAKHFAWHKLIGNYQPKIREFYMTISYEEIKDGS